MMTVSVLSYRELGSTDSNWARCYDMYGFFSHMLSLFIKAMGNFTPMEDFLLRNVDIVGHTEDEAGQYNLSIKQVLKIRDLKYYIDILLDYKISRIQ